MIVPISFAVVAAGTLPERRNLANHARVLQKPQRVVNRREANTGHRLAGLFEDFGRRGMHVFSAHELQHQTTLTGQSPWPWFAPSLGCFARRCHELRIILILNSESRHATLLLSPWSQYRER